MNAVAFVDPVQTLILSPLPVASCRSRDPVRRLWRVLQGVYSVASLAVLAKGARVHKRAARNAAGRGESPPAPSREEASAFDLAFKEAAEGDITAFNAEEHEK